MFREFVVLDPGSSHAVLATGQEPTILRESSLVALSQPKQRRTRMSRLLTSGGARVVAVGREATRLPEMPQEGLYWVSPVTHGTLTDPYALELVFQRLIEKVATGWLRNMVTRKRVGLLIASHLADEEKLRFQEVIRSFGFGRVVLIDATDAAVEGTRMDITAPTGRMLIDFGGGKTAFTAFSMGGTTTTHWLPFGGQHLDEVVREFILKRYRLRVGIQKARRIKETLGSLYPQPDPEALEIRGPDAASGIEKKVTLEDNELRDILIDGCEPLLMGIQQAFERITPELSSDIAQSDILVTGGSARMTGLAAFLSERTGLDFKIPPDPIDVTIVGGLELLRQGRFEDI